MNKAVLKKCIPEYIVLEYSRLFNFLHIEVTVAHTVISFALFVI